VWRAAQLQPARLATNGVSDLLGDTGTATEQAQSQETSANRFLLFAHFFQANTFCDFLRFYGTLVAAALL